MTILFAYDGSEGADAAIAAAATLLTEHEGDAVVLSVWEPLTVQAVRAAKFGAPVAVPLDAGEQDQRSQHQARRIAEHGARIAGELGFEARALWAADERAIADAIVEAGDELDADLIVLGARGLSGIRAFLGSVSNHVLQHARRPLLIVPSPSPAAGEPDRPDAVAAPAS